MDTGAGSIGGSDWQTTDIEVRIRDSHDDPALAGQQAVIRGISVSDFLLQRSYINIIVTTSVINIYYIQFSDFTNF